MYSMALSLLAAVVLSSPGGKNRILPDVDGIGVAIEPLVTTQAGTRTPGVAAATTTFRDLIRMPAEGCTTWLWCFRSMQDNTAYYRDVLVGGRIDVSDPRDGQRWTAETVRSDGQRFTWDGNSAVTYYSYWNGYTNCFVGGGWALCGTLRATIYFYVAAQCVLPTGNWSWKFFDDGQVLFAGQHDFRPTLPPNMVAVYNQGRPAPWAEEPYDSICETYDLRGQRLLVYCGPPPGETYPLRRFEIREKGCFMTAIAEMLAYHRVQTNPSELNQWLYENDGYNELGEVLPTGVEAFAQSRGVALGYLRPSTGATLVEDMCRLGPALIQPRASHWATTQGYTSDALTDVDLADPDGGVIRSYSAAAARNLPPGVPRIPLTSAATRLYWGPQRSADLDHSAIMITVYSPVHMVVTDPKRRRVGYDVATGERFSEVPDAIYNDEGLGNAVTGEVEAHPGKSVEMVRPAEGTYQMDLTGTDEGTYSISVRAYARDLSMVKLEVKSVPIRLREGHSYAFDYSPEPGAQPQMSGGFTGGGQRPRDVDRFLTYATPVARSTKLPRASTSYLLRIYYGPSVSPSSFTAVLDGLDISAQFNPAPRTHEDVPVSVSPGRNVLKLSIDGKAGNRSATDTDRLVFLVP